MGFFFLYFYISFLYSTFFLIIMFYSNNGDDNMKLNFVVPIICAVLLGYLCASFIFNNYGVENYVFNEKGNIYLLQCGAYNNEETSKKEIKGIDEKITIKEDDKYYSYIGMTTDYKIAEKIQKLYKKENIDIYIKDSYLDDEDFINQLTQYDVLLESSNTKAEINAILKTVLATYDELISNN